MVRLTWTFFLRAGGRIFFFNIFFSTCKYTVLPLGAVRKYRCFFRDDIGASGGGGGLSHVRLFEH